MLATTPASTWKVQAGKSGVQSPLRYMAMSRPAWVTHMPTSTHILGTTPVLEPRCPVTESGKPFQRQPLCHAGPSFDSKFVTLRLLTIPLLNVRSPGIVLYGKPEFSALLLTTSQRPTKRWSTGSREQEGTKPNDADHP